MTEFLLSIDLEGVHVITIVVENCKSCIIWDDLEKTRWLLFITWLSNMLMLTFQQKWILKFH